MQILLIDPGKYSFKAFFATLERRQVRIRQCYEFPMAQLRSSLGENQSDGQLQIEALKGLVKNLNFTGKIISYLPDFLTTTRILTLPVESKKKAMALIPFQLEDDLPFTNSEFHFASRVTELDHECHALISISEKKKWDQFFTFFNSQKTLPDILTPTTAVVQSFFHGQDWNGNIALLDIGHTSTRAYFLKDGLLKSTHIFGVGGHSITEAISKYYQIDYQEAQKYKHENAFVLTEDQASKATEDQLEFSQLMDKIFSGLQLQFKRWDIGHRINTGATIEQIYITGGTAGIRNLLPYLENLFQIKTIPFNPYQGAGARTHPYQIERLQKNGESFHFCQLLAFEQTLKTRTLNLRFGEYASRNHDDLPLHNFFHLFWRVAIVAFVIFVGQFSHRLFLSLDDKELNARLSEVLKKPELSLSAAIRRNAAKDPSLVLEKINKNEQEIEQDIKLIQSSTIGHGLDELDTLSQFLKDKPQIGVFSFKKENTQILISFKSDSLKELEKIKPYLETSLFGQAQNVELVPSEKIIRATYLRQ